MWREVRMGEMCSSYARAMKACFLGDLPSLSLLPSQAASPVPFSLLVCLQKNRAPLPLPWYLSWYQPGLLVREPGTSLSFCDSFFGRGGIVMYFIFRFLIFNFLRLYRSTTIGSLIIFSRIHILCSHFNRFTPEITLVAAFLL